MLSRYGCQVLSVALDLHAVCDGQDVAFAGAAFTFELAIEHACLQWERPDLLKAFIHVVLPCKPLVDVSVVLNKLTDCDLSKFGLESDIIARWPTSHI